MCTKLLNVYYVIKRKIIITTNYMSDVTFYDNVQNNQVSRLSI